MIKPLLFIGVGGSGRSTLHWLYNDIKQQLIEEGWPWRERELKGNPMPRCWQFLSIDSEIKDNDKDPQVPPLAIPRLTVAPVPDELHNVYTALGQVRLGAETLGWVPRRNLLPDVVPSTGAGQWRALGRTMILSELPRVKEAVDAASSALSSPAASDDLTQLSKLFRTTSGSINDGRVILVSSLAGGSGSGMWLDIAQYLGGTGPNPADAWKSQRQMAFLYLPEIYKAVRSVDGVGPNSMAAISELMAAYADRSEWNSISRTWANSLQTTPNSRKAPKSIFFVGRRSGGVDFTDTNQIYAATARTLAALVLDDTNSNTFDRVTVNDQSESEIPLFKQARIPSSTIGFGRLDLGRIGLGEYATRRITRSAIDSLLGRTMSGQVRTDDAVRASAEKCKGEFFSACGLYEENTEFKHDQILDALLPKSNRASLAKPFNDGFQGMVDTLSRLRGKKDLEARREMEEAASRVSFAADHEILRNVSSYGDTVRQNMLNAISTYSATHSVPAVLILLEHLDKQLDRASNQLDSESANNKKSVADLLARFTKDWEKGQNTGDQLLHESLMGKSRQAAVAFIRDVRSDLVGPVRGALAAWLRGVSGEITQVDAWSSLCIAWDGITPPTDLVPPPTTAQIEPVESYPEAFDRLLANMFNMPIGDAAVEAVKEVVAGSWKSAGLAAQTHAFVTEVSSFSLSSLAPQTFENADDALKASREKFQRFVTAGSPRKQQLSVASLNSIEDAVRHWVLHRAEISDYVKMGLSAWLEEGHDVGEFDSRLISFAASLNAAIVKAAPSVLPSTNALQSIHGKKNIQETLTVSPYFPFAGESKQSAAVKEVVSKIQGLQSDNLKFENAGNENPSRIDFLRTYSDGLHPLALSSLTDSVRLSLADPGAKYWLARRSRPLAGALGLTPAQLVALARGWLLTTMLGLIDVESGHTYFSGVESEIPRDRLTDQVGLAALGPNRASTWLSAALGSLPVRLFNFGEDPRSLDWYVALLVLGGYLEGHADSGVEQEGMLMQHGVESLEVRRATIACEALSAWIRTGTSLSLRAKPDESKVGSATGSADERRDAVIATLKEKVTAHTDWHNQILAQTEGKAEMLVTPEAELGPHFITALHQLLEQVQSLNLTQVNVAAAGDIWGAMGPEA